MNGFLPTRDPARDPFNEKDPIVAKLQQVLMLYPGAVEPKNATELDFRQS